MNYNTIFLKKQNLHKCKCFHINCLFVIGKLFIISLFMSFIFYFFQFNSFLQKEKRVINSNSLLSILLNSTRPVIETVL
ncbi:hypothetical protein LEQ41_02885 [Streptococcus agalactiae]|nr:hypothetical protein [Streptococcus agalactiae]